MTVRSLSLSPKIIGPLVAAFAAFAQAKIHDAATATLIVALIGAVGLYFAPPGDVAAVVDPVFDDDDDVDPADTTPAPALTAPLLPDVPEGPLSGVEPDVPSAVDEENPPS